MVESLLTSVFQFWRRPYIPSGFHCLDLDTKWSLLISEFSEIVRRRGAGPEHYLVASQAGRAGHHYLTIIFWQNPYSMFSDLSIFLENWPSLLDLSQFSCIV